MPRFAIVLILIVQMFGCDLTGGPDQVQRRVETQLRYYFPGGHAIVTPEEASIFALTCTQGMGKPAIEQIAKQMVGMRSIQTLEYARHLPLKLSPYRIFILQFDEYYIRLDTDTEQRTILPNDPESQLRYEQFCGIRGEDGQPLSSRR